MDQTLKKSIFIVVLYVILLIMMYTYSGLLINNGDGENKSLYYSFFGFSIITSIVCIVEIGKNDSSSEWIKPSMGLATLFMFSFLLFSVIVSKPNSEKSFEILTYINIGLVFIVNISSILFLLNRPTKISAKPVINNGSAPTVSINGSTTTVRNTVPATIAARPNYAK